MTDHGIPPKCRREACLKPAKWNESIVEWGVYCGRECYRLDKAYFSQLNAKKEPKKPIDRGEPPKCDRIGCTKLVRWLNGRWNTYCSSYCAMSFATKNTMKKTRKIYPGEIFDNPEVVPSWFNPED